MNIAHDESDGRFQSAFRPKLTFKSKNPELSPPGREVRRSQLTDIVGIHTSIIAT